MTVTRYIDPRSAAKRSLKSQKKAPSVVRITYGGRKYNNTRATMRTNAQIYNI